MKTLPVDELNCPAGQFVHEVAPTELEKVPLGHCEHTPAPSKEKYPGLQLIQEAIVVLP